MTATKGKNISRGQKNIILTEKLKKNSENIVDNIKRSENLELAKNITSKVKK